MSSTCIPSPSSTFSPSSPPSNLPSSPGSDSNSSLIMAVIHVLSHMLHPYLPYVRAFIISRPWILVFVRMVKFLYGLATNTSELYRLCIREVIRRKQHPILSSNAVSADCIAEIDQSLLFSKHLTIERRAIESSDCGLEDVCQMIMLKKRFPGNGNMNTPEAVILLSSLAIIHESHRVIAEINSRVSTRYDTDNKTHERKLLELWSLLMPTTPLSSRRTKQWTDIGFQGDDPSTDFRSMGVHGLDDLVFLAKNHPGLTAHIMRASHDPISWFSMAIAGINISAYVVSLLRTRHLQYIMYQYGPTKDTVHEFYCYVFARFVEHWTGHEGQPPLQIIDFEREFKQVQAVIEETLLIRAVDYDLHRKYE